MTLEESSFSTQKPESENLLDNDSKPVTLGPGWESRHSNSDLVRALNKGESEKPPKDRLNLLFIIMMLHGVGTLMPWNMFITAKEYFTDIKLNTSLIEDTNSTDYRDLSNYNTGFLGYIVIASQLPNVLCNLMNLFIQFGSDTLGPRMAGSLMVEVVLFVITVVVAMVDSSKWPITFFFIILVIVAFLNAAGGIYQNSTFGLVAKLPGKYTGAVVLGTNVSGTLTALLSIISTFASPSQRTAAIYYFISAIFVLLLCLDTYFALPLLRIYRFYQSQGSSDDRSERRPSLLAAFKQCWFNCLNVFLCFFATLACFPAITGDIVAKDENFPVSKEYFVKIFCFLFFNMFAMFGNMFPMWFKFPKTPRSTFVPVFLRLFFIPFFLMCNFKPAARLHPVFFGDYTYIAVMVLFALSHGYYSTLTMMYSTYGVSDRFANIAGQMAALFLVIGIFAGGNFLFVVQSFILKPIAT